MYQSLEKTTKNLQTLTNTAIPVSEENTQVKRNVKNLLKGIIKALFLIYQEIVLQKEESLLRR